MDLLRYLTPRMIERGLGMHFVAYKLIRCVIQKAAVTYDADLGRISFKRLPGYRAPVYYCRLAAMPFGNQAAISVSWYSVSPVE